MGEVKKKGRGRPKGSKSPRIRIDVGENYSKATRDFMKNVVGELNQKEELSPMLQGQLVLLRECYELFVKAARDIYEHDELYIVTEKGGIAVNPATNIMLKANAQVVAVMKEMGLTTKSRRVLDGTAMGDDALSLFDAADFDK